MAEQRNDLGDNKALVLFSGGQDSTTCLAWALQTFAHVETLSFDYGQRHAVELDAVHVIRDMFTTQFSQWTGRLHDHHHLSLDCLNAVSETALTREANIEISKSGLPTSFVPGRNLLFFTYAAALGYRRSILHLIGGMCETDYSGYPDCRAQTLSALETAIRFGMEKEFKIHTPLMHLDKGQSWVLAAALGGECLVEIIRLHSHTCYMGQRDHLHEWGYGCGECPACRLRAKGYARYRQSHTPGGSSDA